VGIVPLNCSVFPFACRLEGDVALGSRKIRFHTCPKNWLVNCGPSTERSGEAVGVWVGALSYGAWRSQAYDGEPDTPLSSSSSVPR